MIFVIALRVSFTLEFTVKIGRRPKGVCESSHKGDYDNEVLQNSFGLYQLSQ